MAKGVVKRKKPRLARRANEWDTIKADWTWAKAHYYVHYEIDSKQWLVKCKEYIKKNYDKKIISDINKLPDWKVGGKSHYAVAAHMEEHFPANVHPGYEGALDRWIKGLAEEGAKVAEEKKAEEKTKKNVYVPSIQERITEQAWAASEDIDEWLEGFVVDKDKFDPNSFDFKKHFRNKNINQAHARKMKTFFENELDDFKELELMPTAAKLKKLDERAQDMWAQLKEGYSHLKKNDIKKYTTAIENLLVALDFVIDSAKANRKPRKAKPKSATKMVEKLKYLKADEKYKIASVAPEDIIGSSEMWVFNVKTRKLGKYVAQNIDPTGQGREGSGLSVKGTTIQGYNEQLSIQKTLRKPDETLKEFKAAGKVKLRKFMDEIKTTDIKLNGRINTDTIILKIVK